MVDPTGLNLHQDVALFREAINYTAARTGFNARLIEKDYFCSVALSYLAQHGGEQLVFKGGTCLAKVHAGFYRLSEDLDFVIPTPLDANRTQRRQSVESVKCAVSDVAKHLPDFSMTESLTGANNSTQYNGIITYQSPSTGRSENILIEVSVREPLLLPAEKAHAQTLLLDPISGQSFVPNVKVNCIAKDEAFAEKFRAALSRRDVAIRDFYDLDYATQHLNLDIDDPKLIAMIKSKLDVPGNCPVNVSPERLADLKRQLSTRLKPVLQEEAFQTFNLERSFERVASVAQHFSL